MWRDRRLRVSRDVEIDEDPARFEAFAAEASARLWRGFVGVRGEDGADEAVAEAMAWAWEHRDRLATMDNPVGYLYRVGLTRSTRRPPPQLPAPEEVGLPDVEPGLIPALLALPEKQRATVWLLHGCGWSYAEVAEALHIGRSTVGTHATCGLASLREHLEVTIHG